MTSPAGLLEDLVATPSPSGEEAACGERLVEYFESHDREVFVDDAGNVRAPADDRVLLTSHVDTVPGEVPVRVEDGVLWGRGSVDAKGPLAAMAVAAVRTGVSFAGVTGEESDSRGARHLVAERDEPDAVVNGEPSGWDAITLGYRGFLRARYESETESEHTSLPGPNALEHAVAWWSAVTDAIAADADPDAPVFESVTPKLLGMDGGLADDGHAFTATLDASIRVPPGVDTDALRATVEAQTGHDADAGSVAWLDEIPAVMESARSPVAAALRAGIRAAGGEPTHLRKTGTSDMNLFAGAWSCPMATYGPGDSSLDHAPDERIALADLERAVDVLAAATERL